MFPKFTFTRHKIFQIIISVGVIGSVTMEYMGYHGAIVGTFASLLWVWER